MTRQILATIASLLMLNVATGGTRIIEQVENSVELTLAALNLPNVGGETISFSACATCGVSTHRVTATTVYKVNGHDVPFAEFLRIAAELGDRPTDAAATFAAVFLDIASGRVTRIEIREATQP